MNLQNLKYQPVALAMAAAVLVNLAIVRFGGASLSEVELVSVALFVQAAAGVVSTRWTRSKASVEEEHRLHGPFKGDEG